MFVSGVPATFLTIPPGTDPPAAAQPSPHPVEERTGELAEVGQTVKSLKPKIRGRYGKVWKGY